MFNFFFSSNESRMEFPVMTHEINELSAEKSLLCSFCWRNKSGRTLRLRDLQFLSPSLHTLGYSNLPSVSLLNVFKTIRKGEILGIEAEEKKNKRGSIIWDSGMNDPFPFVLLPSAIALEPSMNLNNSKLANRVFSLTWEAVIQTVSEQNKVIT